MPSPAEAPTPEPQPGTDLLGVGRLWAAARHRPGVIALCLVLATVGAAGSSLVASPRYLSSAALLFRDTTARPPPGRLSRGAGTYLTSTRVLLLLLRAGSRTAAGVDHGLRTDDVRARVHVVALGASDFALVSATDTDRARAQRLANVYAESFVGLVRRSGPRGLHVGAVTRAVAARAPLPSGAGRRAAAGAIAGLLLGLALALLLDRLDTGRPQRGSARAPDP